MFSVFAETPDLKALVKAEPLRDQLVLQLPGESAGPPDAQIFFQLVGVSPASAASEGILERGNILPLRHSRFVGSEGGRRYQQRQGNDEMFHENSLEAISGNVKRAA
jgi:hypothetical protein